jgi:hypothetical protein
MVNSDELIGTTEYLHKRDVVITGFDCIYCDSVKESDSPIRLLTVVPVDVMRAYGAVKV